MVGPTSLEAQVMSRNDRGEVIVTYRDGSWRYMMPSDSIILRDAYNHFKMREAQSNKLVEPLNEESTTPTEDSVLMHIVEENPERAIAQRRLDMLLTRKRRADDKLILLSDKEYGRLIGEINEIKVMLGYDDLHDSNPNPQEPVVVDNEGDDSINVDINKTDNQSELKPSTSDSLVSQSIDRIPSNIDDEQVLTVIDEKFDLYDRNMYKFEPVSTGDVVLMKDDCIFLEEEEEILSSNARKTLISQPLIRPLDSLNKDIDLVYVDMALTQAHQNLFVVLDIRIVYGELFDSMGYARKMPIIDKGVGATLILVDGSEVHIDNIIKLVGRRQPFGNAYTFQLRSLLNKNMMKSLQRMELDKIIIHWEDGDKSYDIFDITLIQRQLTCMDQL